MLTLPETLTQKQACQNLSALGAALALDGAQVVVDASALRQFDSTALAVLLALRRQALALGKSMQLHGLPPRLANLARLYGVNDLLGMDSSTAQAAPPIK